MSATLLVLGWLLGGVMGVALGLAGWAGVMVGQLAGYVWSQVAATGHTGNVPVVAREDRREATAATVMVE